ncbi:MAG: adenosine-specific kinase [Candidatus Latescibacteria bacterium]|nr:adenosine-specific kinase [Candidatus Latescibacterota bacterium]
MTPDARDLTLVPLETPTGANLILGHAHFIKTAEDLYEAVVNSVPGVKFGIAFSEASGPRLIRSEGNDDALTRAAERELQKIACGHAFLIFLVGAYPINLLRDIRACVEVCAVHCATANPVTVVVLRDGDSGAILGVMDGLGPKGIETPGDARERRDFVRTIGYKRS